MKSTLSNSLSPKNILIKLFSSKILSNLETKFAFFNNLRMVTMTMKTIKVKLFKLKAVSSRLKTMTIKMRDSNSPSLKFNSCFNNKKTKEEVDKRKTRSKPSHPSLNHSHQLLKFNTLPQRNNFNKRRKRPAHPRVRVSIPQ